MNWLMKRLREPSTALAVGSVAMGLDAFAASGNWVSALVVGLGALGAAMSEQGDAGA